MGRPQLLIGQRYDAGLIIESWRLWEGLVEALPTTAKRVSTWSLDSDYFEIKYPSGVSIAAVVAQGASIAVDALERLAGAGARSIVRIGTTGGLQRDQHIGDVVLPFCAIRNEGTSGHYLRADVPACASLPLLERIRAALLLECGVDVRPTMSWTTDGRWVESDKDILELSGLGISAVDMETAALFAAGTHRAVAVASVSVIADLPILHVGADFKGLPPGEEEWNEVLRRSRSVVRAVLEAITSKPIEDPGGPRQTNDYDQSVLSTSAP
jgi:nucleoside phosphorylase